ncbi:MAG: radical SAM protein, partial [Chloroflexia bacterium]
VLAAFARPRPIAGGLPRRLAGVGLLVPVEEARPAPGPAPEGDTLTVWLHLTSACNLRCTYCYVPQQDGAMSPTTAWAALETAFRTAARHGFRAVKLKYAGGEPTLAFSLVRLLHRQAGRHILRYGLEVRETLLTNGVALDDRLLDFAAAAGMRLAVSLDPSRRVHDGRRILPDGSGTFERICRNLERAVGRGLRPFLSITLCGEEGEEEAEAVALALELDLPFHLNFVRPADGRISPERIERLIAAVRAAFARIAASPPRRSLLGILDRADFSRPHRYPCAAVRSYLVVDTRGRLVPCQMELAHPAGDLSLEDPLAALRAVFPNPAVEERAGCATCPWREACAGGCPWLAACSSGRADAPSPYCAAYRVLYPELLRLEGLRLLAQAGA